MSAPGTGGKSRMHAMCILSLCIEQSFKTHHSIGHSHIVDSDP